MADQHGDSLAFAGQSSSAIDKRTPSNCCLIDKGKRCLRAASSHSYTVSMQKSILQKRLKLHLDPSAWNLFICDFHKQTINNDEKSPKKRSAAADSDDEVEQTTTISLVPKVDFGQLSANTLKRCRKYFKLQARPGLNKSQLTELIERHILTLPVNESEICSQFLCSTNAKSSNEDKQGKHSQD